MSLHIEPLSSLPQLRGLLEVTRLVRDERDLTRLVDKIAETISESLGWGTVAINLYRPAEGDFEVTTVHGNEAAREALLGTLKAPDAWTPLLAERFLYRGAYMIPHDEADWEGVLFHIPDIAISADPNAWHPEDALIVPMRGGDGTLLGVVSVDEPETGLRPSDEELDVLVAFAEHVIVAYEGVQVAAEAARDRASLKQLLDVSGSFVDLDTVESVLENVARGIQEALEFEKVAVCLADAGNFSPSGTAGWETDAPGLDFKLTDSDLELLLVPEFEIEGCYLIESEVAVALVGDGSNYRSERGGAGPRAWSNHWLLVPLIKRDGSRSGFVWADDPSDSMLPSRERLQALRTFANQATMALENARLYAAVRQSEELHRYVVDGSTDMIALLDRKNEVVLASSAYEQVLGYPPAEMLGSKLAELLHPEDLAAARAAVVDDAVADPILARMRHRDGGWVLVEGITTPIRNDRGEVELILVIARDVTERQRLEEQLRQAQKMESVGRLAGGIAHDFNNLLTAIRGYAELMLIDFDAGTEPGRDCAEQIARAADRAASLTGQLLAFSRKQVLRPQLIDLNEIVEGMATMLKRMLGEDVVLSTALDPELEPTLADPTQLEQVVLNLALNARDAMPKGGSLSLHTRRLELREDDELPHPDLVPGLYVTLTVSDTGIGMDTNLAEQVFEPFFTTKDVGEGTGLGLSTVHGIVSQSGGAILMDSTLGEGTRFTVCLPVAGDAP